MPPLLYKEDADDARDRLSRWWNGENIGRPAMLLYAPRVPPVETIPPLSEPKGWVTHYSTRDFAYRVYLARRACVSTWYLAEAMPAVSPDLAPNCLALYLGCRGVEQPGTVWCEPCMDMPERARFELDPDNVYWTFTLRLADAQLRDGRGKFLTAFPDLIEGLDTLAAMRGTEPLLTDLIERPDWVQQALGQITERYFDAYDRLYDLIRDERGGSHFWAWAPGRMAKLQCDFSAMISPAMFAEFMAPVLTRMTERLDFCLYHWDGPGAMCHLDTLLSIPRLPVIQWTPGAGAEGVADRRWWPVYHRILEAGKSIDLHNFPPHALMTFRREFGAKWKRFMFKVHCDTLEEARCALAQAEG